VAPDPTRPQLDEQSAQLAAAGMALIACQSASEVFDVIGEYLSEALPSAIGLVNRCEEDARHIIVHAVTGLDASAMARAAALVGFDVIGRRAVISETDVERVFVRSLQEFEGGFEGYVASELPPAVGRSAAKALGIHGAYIIGITDGSTTYGNISILTRDCGLVLPVHAIETLSRQAFLTLARIATAAGLAESEARNRLLFENMSQGLAVHDIILDDQGVPCDYRFLQVNPAFERITGLSGADVIGRRVLEVIPGLEPAWIKRYGAVATTGIAARFEDHVADIGMYFEVIAYSPQEGRFATIVSDITERKASEEALRESERWLSESQRVAGLGHYVYDIVKDYWDGSPTLHDVLGTRDGRGGDFDAWLEIVHPDDRARLASYFQDEVVGARAPFDNEYRIVRPRDGVERRVHGLGTVEFDRDGRALEMFGIIQDITDRERAADALRTSEQKFRGVFESASDGIFLLSAQGVMVSLNPAMAEMHGYTVDEMISMDLTRLDAPGTAALAPERMRRLLGGEPLSFEVEHFREDGSIFPLDVSASLVTIGDQPFVLAFHRDISERKQAEEEIRHLNAGLEERVQLRTEELQRANEDLSELNLQLQEATLAKSAFLAAMSHELRTPLNSIIGFSGILLQGLAGPLEYEQRVQVEMVNRSGRHLLSLIDDLLDLAKVEAGKVALNIGPLDPDTLIREVADAVRPLASEKGLALEVMACGSGSAVLSDAGKVRQILFNLVGNAVKFTDRGSVHLAVHCEVGGACTFAIADTGPGIAPEDLSRMFEPFTQLDSSTVAKPKGTGLGLRISREYAHLLGGEISVVSEVGAGSTFTLTLPARPPEVAPAD
jgi:PAS domain S-box-containing protein